MPAAKKKKAIPNAKSANTSALNRTIERAKQELERMIDLNPQVMLLVNRNGEIVRANKALLNLVRHDDYRKILGKRLDNLFRTRDAVFFNHLLNDQPCACEAREAIITLPDGERMLRFTGVAFGSNTNLCVVIVNDVTVEREQAAHLEKKHKKEAVQNLMGGLMHNINQPLTVIMVKARLMHLEVENGRMRTAEMTRNLQEIMQLTMQIADMLESVEKPGDFVTQPYLGNVRILDLNRSASRSDRLESFCMNALMDIIRAADIHEPWASEHAQRTGEYAAILARNMKLDEKAVQTAKRCGVLHDIGKIGIPDSILQKPAPLTTAEMAIMKTHTEIGYNLLRNLPFLAEEAEVAYTHHERYDQSGYPRRIAGEDIPLMARIVAVADAFEALRFIRCYQPSIPLGKVVKIIAAESGKQFAPEVIKVFMRCYKELEAVADR
jgi:putative nucleotidyltransferase with HDIG domain